MTRFSIMNMITFRIKSLTAPTSSLSAPQTGIAGTQWPYLLTLRFLPSLLEYVFPSIDR